MTNYSTTCFSADHECWVTQEVYQTHLLSVSPVSVEAAAWSVDTAVLSAAAGHASALFSDIEIQPGDGDAAAIELLLLATAAISNLPRGHQVVQYWAREKGKCYKGKLLLSEEKPQSLTSLQELFQCSLFYHSIFQCSGHPQLLEGWFLFNLFLMWTAWSKG